MDHKMEYGRKTSTRDVYPGGLEIQYLQRNREEASVAVFREEIKESRNNLEDLPRRTFRHCTVKGRSGKPKAPDTILGLQA
jgi:hypothetical protein